MSAASLSLGPYRLLEKIGQGGMGDVWRAGHAVHPIPIAIKVMRNEPLSSRARQAFHNEIRQVSKLDHQGITMVYDSGEIAPDDAHASGGQLREGHPYIAMEYAQRGSLDKLGELLTWRDLVGITRALLLALGHAHARGVLHRDIKPGNVLLGSGDDLRPSIKLTDFGLARALQSTIEPGTGLRIVGTPDYMAPEQVEGLWRDQGPWTDLYAIGCLAYELASGSPPFAAATPRKVALGHLSSPIPPLRAISAVPPDFEAWLQRMMAKECYDRFQSAADAAHALDEIEFEDDSVTARSVTPSRKAMASPTWTFLDLPAPRATRGGGSPARAMHPTDAPPIPSDWRDLERLPEDRPMLGAGLNLFGIRAHRLIGRVEERDRLWAALQAVSTDGHPHAVVLHGPAGLGKRMLARWLMATAQEAGAAMVLEATHSAIPGPTDGLPRMLAKHLGCIGTTGPEVVARTEHMLRLQGVDDPFEWEHLSRMLLVTSGAVSSEMTVPVGNSSERMGLVERYLERLTIHRPLILHVSDAHHGLEAIQLIHRLLRPRADRLPVLLVLSCDSEAMTMRPVERNAISMLQDHPHATSLRIDALPPHDQQALIQDLLRVEPKLGQSVGHRSGGSPLFAIQLVEDWVQRGVLRPGADGLTLAPDEAAELPDSIHEVWQARVERALAGMPGSATTALWTAAALGITVHEADWLQACQALEIEVPEHLLTRLVREGLAETRETGWAFTHGMLRESIERAAEDQWQRINQGCAEMLAERGARRALAERIGRHLVAAGQAEASLTPLLDGATEANLSGEFRRATDLLSLRDQMNKQLVLPESDPRWGRGWVQRIVAEINLRHIEAASALASRCANDAMRHGWTELLSPSFRFLGVIANLKGDFSEADAMFARAEQLLEDDATMERATIHCQWSRSMARLGLREKSLEHLEEARSGFESIGYNRGIADCLHMKAEVYAGQGSESTRAVNLLREALQIYESLQIPSGVGDCWNGIAEVHRRWGDLTAAESAYQTALTHLVRSGVSRAIVPVLNLGLVLLQKEEYEHAALQLEDGLGTAKASGRMAMTAYANMGLMVCAAVRQDWEAWDLHAKAAAATIEQTGITDRDLAWPAERAGDRAVASGKRARAEFAWRLAIDQWSRIGEVDEVQKLQRRLGTKVG